MKILSLLVISLFFCIPERSVHHALDLGAIDAYINPYVSTNNFSGIVLIKKNDQIIFEAAYGFADRERDVKNSGNTRFHIASMSMQYTAVAILRLIDQGMLAFDTRVDSLVAGIEGGDKITIRDLLLQRSGLPDINDLPSYNEILNQHQTPASLVAAIKGRPLIFEPGSKFLHEEHSAYNLLALIMEAKTHLPFASAIEKLVFRPAGLSSSGADDDCENGSDSAKGYQPERVYALKPAATIHWSAKSGSASIFTSARDQARFVDAIFLSDFLKPASRAAILDTAQKVGYGWFRAPNRRFNETAYYMNGRSPGFTSFVLHLPNEHLTAIVFSNIYSSATTSIGYDIAGIALGLPYERFQPVNAAATAGQKQESTATFKFGPDFYQPNAELKLVPADSDLLLRWPSETTALVPLGGDHFMDRSYWVEVQLERNTAGLPEALIYDHFRGTAVP